MEIFMDSKDLLTKKVLMVTAYLKMASFMEFKLHLIKMDQFIKSFYMKMELLKRNYLYEFL